MVKAWSNNLLIRESLTRSVKKGSRLAASTITYPCSKPSSLHRYLPRPLVVTSINISTTIQQKSKSWSRKNRLKQGWKSLLHDIQSKSFHKRRTWCQTNTKCQLQTNSHCQLEADHQNSNANITQSQSPSRSQNQEAVAILPANVLSQDLRGVNLDHAAIIVQVVTTVRICITS